jgi:5-methyltetrahydrofolate--homocysteine methyltransferase
MNKEQTLAEIRNKIVSLEMEGALKAVENAARKMPASVIITDGIAKAMEIVGKKYEENEYFLAELLVSGQVVAKAFEILEPYLKTQRVEAAGKVVFGTVKGDLHDLGKTIVITLLKSAGFEIYDLGVDVPPEKFIEKIREVKPDILAMSVLLTTTMQEIKNTINELEKAGVKKSVKIIIGGRPLTAKFGKEAGADAYAEDAFVGVEICTRWMREKYARKTRQKAA